MALFMVVTSPLAYPVGPGPPAPAVKLASTLATKNACVAWTWANSASRALKMFDIWASNWPLVRVPVPPAFAKAMGVLLGVRSRGGAPSSRRGPHRDRIWGGDLHGAPRGARSARRRHRQPGWRRQEGQVGGLRLGAAVSTRGRAHYASPRAAASSSMLPDIESPKVASTLTRARQQYWYTVEAGTHFARS